MSTHDILMAAQGGDQSFVISISITSAPQVFGFTTSGINGVVDWGDGTATSRIDGYAVSPASTPITTSHTYASNGTYTVRILGDAKLIAFTSWVTDYATAGVAEAVTACRNYGNFFSSIKFYNCSNLVAIPDALPSTVTSTKEMFYGCSLLNQSVARFNTSNVTDMSNMFYNCAVFNQSVSSFNTANVTNMSGMFRFCTVFNQSVSSFNTANVTNMSFMFSDCLAFNQSVSSFNTANVTNMAYMFAGCLAFNQTVNNFNTANVTDMSGMFGSCQAFNQSLSSFNTSNVTSLYQFLQDTLVFNQPLNGFDTSNVTDMGACFNGATAFNQSLSNWNTINVTDMTFMFFGASAFTQNLSGWCVGTIIAEPSQFRTFAGAFTSPTWGACPAYSPASSITRIGAATGVNSATLPAHQAGDLILAFVFRDGSTTLPTQPSGWTTLASRFSSLAGAASSRLSYKIAQSGSETSGTWTNATAAIFVIYRGAYTTDLTSTYAQNTLNTTTTIYYPSNLYWSSLAWTLGFVGSNLGTLAIETPPTGITTLVANYVDASNESAAFDSNGPSVSFAGSSVSVASASTCFTMTLRLRVPITL